jgi:hypothetical protein
MQTFKSFFDIRDYGKAGVMLIRIQEKQKSPGLPPTVSQCIIMEEDEIDHLMEVLNAYKRRDKEL